MKYQKGGLINKIKKTTTPTLDIIGEVKPMENEPTNKENREAFKRTVEAIKNKTEEEGKNIKTRQIKKSIKKAIKNFKKEGIQYKKGGIVSKLQRGGKTALEHHMDSVRTSPSARYINHWKTKRMGEEMKNYRMTGNIDGSKRMGEEMKNYRMTGNIDGLKDQSRNRDTGKER